MNVHSQVQAEFITYCSTSADRETFISPPIHLAGCVERVRIFCRESHGGGGNTDLPGDVQIFGYFYQEG